MSVVWKRRRTPWKLFSSFLLFFSFLGWTQHIWTRDQKVQRRVWELCHRLLRQVSFQSRVIFYIQYFMYCIMYMWENNLSLSKTPILWQINNFFYYYFGISLLQNCNTSAEDLIKNCTNHIQYSLTKYRINFADFEGFFHYFPGILIFYRCWWILLIWWFCRNIDNLPLLIWWFCRNIDNLPVLMDIINLVILQEYLYSACVDGYY